MANRSLNVGRSIELGFARIAVDARIGEGAMGVVWRGWLFQAPQGPRASEPPTPVAIKELHAAHKFDPLHVRFFQNEATAMRRLEHPNVVRFIDLVSTDHSVAIVMEYVDGDTLADVIGRSRARARLAGPYALPALPMQRAWYYFQQLLGALAATHAVGIVHRDIKPTNVLLRRDGIVKLGDFGIARLMTGEPDPAQADSSLAPGTGAYMAPEQVLSRPVSAATDLYSAAVVLYEMLAGRPPFEARGQSEIEIRMSQVNAPVPPIRMFVPQAPPVLDDLFQRALSKDPTQRYANAILFGDAFRRALGLADTPVWRAQEELAREAPQAIASSPPAPVQARVRTLRDFLEHGYAKTRPGF